MSPRSGSAPRWVIALAGGLLLLLAAAGSPTARGDEPPRAAAVDTAAPVIRLAADGATVAAILGSGKGGCGRSELIWDVRRRTPVVMRGSRGAVEHAPSCPPYESNPDLELAVGGGMVGMLRFGELEGGHVSVTVLSVTRLPTDGTWADVTAVSDYEYGAGEGDYLSVLGDGATLAFGKWTVCFAYDLGANCPGVSADGQWFVSDGHLVQLRPLGSRGVTLCPPPSGESYALPRLAPVRACRRIGGGASFTPAVALDRGRFLSLPLRGDVRMIDAGSGRVARLPIPTGSVLQAELDGDDVLILRRDAPGSFVLDVHDASTGALTRTWPLADGLKAGSIHLEDAHAGIVVYRIGTTLHLLRVADGKTHAIAIPPTQAPVHARLEDPGLVYSFSLPGRTRRGRLEFVPWAGVVSHLRQPAG